jgi:hypothetical protein
MYTDGSFSWSFSSNSIDSFMSPNSSWYSCLAHTMQCTGRSGVLRMVQMGYVFGGCFGWHS